MPPGPPAGATPARKGGGGRLLGYWLPVAAYVGLIFSLSSLHNTGPSLFPNMDKVEHLGEYGLFGLLLGRAFRFTVGGARGLWWAVGTVLVGSAIGAMDEFYQSFVPGRSSDVRDWFTDSLALLLAVLFTQLVSVHPLRARGGDGGTGRGPARAEGPRP
jgi:VanZ family protein